MLGFGIIWHPIFTQPETKLLTAHCSLLTANC